MALPPSVSSALGLIGHRLRSCRDDARGAALVEFCIIFPCVWAILELLVILSQGLEIDDKVDLTARTITDIVAQQNGTVSSTFLAEVLNASAAVMSPWGTTPLSIVVSEVQLNSSGSIGSVVWSQGAYNGASLAAGATIAMNGSSLPGSSYQIVGQVSYSYSPLFLTAVTFVESQQIVLSPRTGTAIALATD